MAMVGGHPFLLRVAMYRIARKDTTLDVFLQTAPTEAGAYGDHLSLSKVYLSNYKNF